MDKSQEKTFEIRVKDDINPQEIQLLEREAKGKILGVIAARVIDRGPDGKFLDIVSPLPKHALQLYTLLYTLRLDYKE